MRPISSVIMNLLFVTFYPILFSVVDELKIEHFNGLHSSLKLLKINSAYRLSSTNMPATTNSFQVQ